MIWFICVLALLPLAFLIRLARGGWSWMEAARIAALTALAAIVSGPFLTERALGTGEAHNYAHAVADTVVQVRNGIFPAYVGQSEYAFNGRIHPLRTAVYYNHAPAVLDVVTFHQLGFWTLQNLSLALSLWGAVFAMYGASRALGAAPWVSVGLAAIYGFSPGVLAAAYGVDLYMTVTTTPFLPLAVLGALRSWQTGSFRDYALMSASLAALWLTHPPVAAWTGLGCGIVVALSVVRHRLNFAVAARLVLAAVLGVALSGWAFMSVLSLRDEIVGAGPKDLAVAAITSITKTEGWSSLEPARHAGTALGDFQLGYTAWLLLGILAWVALRQRRSDLIALVVAVLVFLALTLPVGPLHRWLWTVMPASFASITNVWPMQRSYLVMMPFILLGFAAAWPWVDQRLREARYAKFIAYALAAAALGWSAVQGTQFLRRGYRTHKTAAESAQALSPANLNLTGIAYAMMQVPSNFTYGTRDPEQELRLLALDGQTEVLSNAQLGGGAPPVLSGTLISEKDDGLHVEFAPVLQLHAGKKYRLRFEFLTQPLDAMLYFFGDAGLHREYMLPGLGYERGFGMGGGHQSVLTLWTQSSQTENVTIVLHRIQPADAAKKPFAKFTLEEIAADRLPIRLERLVPNLKCTVDATADGWLETPRLFVPGYQATVDGQPVFPRRSMEGLTIVPISPGHHTVELSYRAPTLLRFATWLSLGTWIALGLASIARVAGVWSGEPPLTTFVVLIPIVVVVAWWRFAETSNTPPKLPGPLRLRVLLPTDAGESAEPLVSGGPDTGAEVFVRYQRDGRVRLGVDLPIGVVKQTPPLSLDLRVPHEFIVTSGVIYNAAGKSLGHAAGPIQIEWLKTHTRLWVDGKEVLHTSDAPLLPAKSAPRALENITTNRTYRKKFTGIVLDREWLPIETAQIPWPTSTQLATEAGPLLVTATLSREHIGQAEPLLTLGGANDPNRVCFFVHSIDGVHVRLGVQGPTLGPVFTEPFTVDFDRPLVAAISHPTLYAPAGIPTSYSAHQRTVLLSRVRIALNDRWIVSVPIPGKNESPAGSVAFGKNIAGATYPNSTFHGFLSELKRLPVDRWPVPPGDPSAALVSGTAGELEITAQLPQNMTGRTQPLLTIGQPQKGAFVIVKYLDQSHIQIGLDVWNKLLAWSEPITVDFMQPHRFRISMSALFPLDHPGVKALPESVVTDLREKVRVSVDDREALKADVFSYDSAVTEITPGASHIGGSYTEAEFLGEILNARRLPLPKP